MLYMLESACYLLKSQPELTCVPRAADAQRNFLAGAKCQPAPQNARGAYVRQVAPCMQRRVPPRGREASSQHEYLVLLLQVFLANGHKRLCSLVSVHRSVCVSDCRCRSTCVNADQHA